MAKHRRVELLPFLILYFAAIFVDFSACRHVGSCPGCHGDKRLEDNLSTLSNFWKKVQAAMTDAEKQLGTGHEKGGKTANDVIGSHKSRIADKRANRRPVANDAQSLSDAGIIANLTARVAALEQTMLNAVSVGERLKSEVRELSSSTEGDREPTLPRHVRNHVGHLEENVNVLEMMFGAEQAKIRRYEEELAHVIGKQARLEKMLEDLESLASFRSLVPEESNKRHNGSPRSHDSTRPTSGHREAISQETLREEKVPLKEDPDSYDYEYDYDYTHEARGQR